MRRTTKVAKSWKCQECGKLMTPAQAERAMSVGCPKCNGGDIALIEPALSAQDALELAKVLFPNLWSQA